MGVVGAQRCLSDFNGLKVQRVCLNNFALKGEPRAWHVLIKNCGEAQACAIVL